MPPITPYIAATSGESIVSEHYGFLYKNKEQRSQFSKLQKAHQDALTVHGPPPTITDDEAVSVRGTHQLAQNIKQVKAPELAGSFEELETSILQQMEQLKQQRAAEEDSMGCAVTRVRRAIAVFQHETHDKRTVDELSGLQRISDDALPAPAMLAPADQDGLEDTETKRKLEAATKLNKETVAQQEQALSDLREAHRKELEECKQQLRGRHQEDLEKCRSETNKSHQAESDVLREDLEAEKLRCSGMEDELNRVSTEYTTMQQQLKEMQDQAQAQHSSETDQQGHMDQLEKDLQDTREQIQKQSDANGSLQTQCHDSQQAVLRLEQANKKLQSSLNDSKADRNQDRLDQEKALQRQKEAADGAIADAKKLQCGNEELERQVRDLQQKVEDLTKEKAMVSSNASELQRQLEQLNKKCAGLQSTVTSKDIALRSSESESMSWMKQAQNNDGRCNEKANQLKKVESTLKSAHRDLELQNKWLTQLENKLLSKTRIGDDDDLSLVEQGEVLEVLGIRQKQTIISLLEAFRPALVRTRGEDLDPERAQRMLDNIKQLDIGSQQPSARPLNLEIDQATLAEALNWNIAIADEAWIHDVWVRTHSAARHMWLMACCEVFQTGIHDVGQSLIEKMRTTCIRGEELTSLELRMMVEAARLLVQEAVDATENGSTNATTYRLWACQYLELLIRLEAPISPDDVRYLHKSLFDATQAHMPCEPLLHGLLEWLFDLLLFDPTPSHW